MSLSFLSGVSEAFQFQLDMEDMELHKRIRNKSQEMS